MAEQWLPYVPATPGQELGSDAHDARQEARHHPHRPTPDPATGELLVDPDIRLRAAKFNLDINFVYSSYSDETPSTAAGDPPRFEPACSRRPPPLP